jgi:hypothetical protein
MKRHICNDDDADQICLEKGEEKRIKRQLCRITGLALGIVYLNLLFNSRTHIICKT